MDPSQAQVQAQAQAQAQGSPSYAQPYPPQQVQLQPMQPMPAAGYPQEGQVMMSPQGYPSPQQGQPMMMQPGYPPQQGQPMMMQPGYAYPPQQGQSMMMQPGYSPQPQQPPMMGGYPPQQPMPQQPIPQQQPIPGQALIPVAPPPQLAPGSYVVVTEPPPVITLYGGQNPAAGPFKWMGTRSGLKGEYALFTSNQVTTPYTVDDIVRFFASYSGRPQLQIKVQGYHHRTHRNQNGGTTTEKVIDWTLEIDANPYIAPLSRLTGVEEAAKHYHASIKSFKRINMMNTIQWDFTTFQTICAQIARSRGYTHSVEVIHNLVNATGRLQLEESNDWHDCCDHTCTKIFCYLTCTCCCWYCIKSAAEDSTFVENVFGINADPQAFAAGHQHLFPMVEKGAACSIM